MAYQIKQNKKNSEKHNFINIRRFIMRGIELNFNDY